MPRRYLFGPVTPASADRNLRRQRQAGHCLTFGYATAGGGSLDLTVSPADSWDEIAARLPGGWSPDYLVLDLAHTTVPRGVWAAPLPRVGLAREWPWLWHGYRHLVPACDLVLTDPRGAELLARAGVSHARAARLGGCPRALLEAGPSDGPRDLDILVLGDLHPALQGNGLSGLTRLARLGDRWRVAIRPGASGEALDDLLRRARIVLDTGLPGLWDPRSLAAAASGALLFQEAGGRPADTAALDLPECVPYTADDLERLLEQYLTREAERRALAEAARARVSRFGCEDVWDEATGLIERDWAVITERANRREPGGDTLRARCWQALSTAGPPDRSLVQDLASYLREHPESAAAHNALGLLTALPAHGAGPGAGPRSLRAAGCFHRAVECNPAHATARLNLAQALVEAGRTDEATEQARQALALLEQLPPDELHGLDEGPFPPGFDLFRAEWERAAWANAGRPGAEARAKRDLLRWRLYTLLGELTDDLPCRYDAVLARPDLAVSRAALGCALARCGRLSQAVTHLRQAVADDPFDQDAARALFQALGDVGDAAGQAALAHDRRLLARAAPATVPVEPWFAEAPPAAGELASLLILCCNEADYTRRCLASVLRHTRPPYELVLVDNGSTDATPALLEEFRTRPGPERVTVIRNATNVGFPAGCNQALAQARGRYLVFLNNDTIVTAGWLEGLIIWALHDWPSVGMVGAVTNYSRPPQLVACAYADPSEDTQGLDDFAARRRQEYAGRALAVERLSGFCLLARREVLGRVGGFDEGYGLGFFDDDDLSVRVRQAGLRLLVGSDVFVHHFGSRTFTGLGVDYRRQLKENFARFRAKWGPEQCAGYRFPGAEASEPFVDPPATVVPAPRGTRPRVSLCLIVKNEEANLPACLASAADLVDEVVVVDTGSTDRTRELAAQHGARVVDFPWCDSFAAARNESLRHATGVWIFWMDADDRLDEDNRARLRALFAGLDDANIAYSMKCACLPDPVSGATTVVDHVRLFRNHPDIRWRYRVHEQILPAIRQAGGDVRWADVVIHHVGYQDPALRRRKLDRDLRLLDLENAEHPDEPFTLFNLASVYQELGRPADALPLLVRSLERSHPSDSIVRKLYALVAHCHRQLGQPGEALAACRAGREYYPDDAELLFQEGMGRREQGDLAGAEACLVRLVHGDEGPHFASVEAGLRGYKARHHLAAVYHQRGRRAEAEAEWRRVLDEQPDFAPAWLGIGELCLAQGKWDELEQAARGLEAAAGDRTDAAVLRARGHLARREFTPAQELLQQVIAEQPRALWPRVLLSHALLQEGRDWEAAERALQDVLALDPHNVEACGNLTVLRRQLGRDVGEEWAQGLTLAGLYDAACKTPSDINEHLQTLYELASRCRHVTEMGTRTGVSTTALLFAQPEALVGYDLRKYPEIYRLEALAGKTRFRFHKADVLRTEIEETDMLFIDTRHVYDQLKEELRLHAGKVRRYIVLHDTTTFGDHGEDEGTRGLWPAVEEFVAAGVFRLKQRFENNHGLTILERERNGLPTTP
jgi:glycosyltransferase involved in cell wall biosynthesis/Flp pilus assembly protein TadD